MTDLVERLRAYPRQWDLAAGWRDQFGGNARFPDTKALIAEAADALEAARAIASTPIDPDMPAQQLRLHMGELTASELRVARAAIAWANTAAQAQAAEAADLLGALWNWPEDPSELTGSSFSNDEVVSIWKAYRIVAAIRVPTDAAKGDRA